MKKILLINTNTETKPYPVPPLGLAMVASSLKELREVKVFDGTFTSYHELPDVITDFQPDYIGFSVRNIDDMTYDNLNYYVEDVLRNFITPVKELTKVPLIIGGAGFSMFPEILMEKFALDYGVIGQGEIVFPLLLDALDAGCSDIPLPGLITRNADGLHIECAPQSSGAYFQQHTQIDHWINFDPYRQRGAYTIQTKKGCAFHCIYCTYPVIEGASSRIRKAVDIVDEMQQAFERVGNVVFEFADSVFNDPPGHAEAICSEIIQRGLKFRMRTMGINPEHVSKELLTLMLQAGFTQIDCTPDSASETMLKRLGKNFNMDQLRNAASLIREMNIPAMWFFMLGGPGETPATIDETFDFIDHYIGPEDMVHLTSGLRIYPKTPLEKIALHEGLIPAGSDLLVPVFYFSKETPHNLLIQIIEEKCRTRGNCIPSFASAPPPEMMQQALKLRAEQGLEEPMFRTLLRIKQQQINN